jgi:hypothetical protein
MPSVSKDGGESEFAAWFREARPSASLLTMRFVSDLYYPVFSPSQ